MRRATSDAATFPSSTTSATRACTQAVSDAVRRGGRRRRGRAPALGQLGGRRRDPGCRHRPLPRRRQGAHRRLRRRSGSASAVPRSRRGPRRASRSSPRSRTPRCRTASPRHPPISSSSRRSASPTRRGILAEVRAAEAAVGREGEPLRVYADIVVFLDGDEPAADRLERLDGLGRLLVSDTRIFTGSAAALADEIAALGDARLRGRASASGCRHRRPRRASRTTLVPELRRRGLLADERRHVAARRAGPSHHRSQPLRAGAGRLNDPRSRR